MTDLIRRELQLPASTDEVWAALTDPERLGAWLADEAEIELWPGGDARFVTDGVVRTGWVEEVLPPRADGEGAPARLAFWWAAGDEIASRVELSVSPVAGGSRLRVVETRPLQVLDLAGIPLSGNGGRGFGPALVAA